MTGRTLRVGPYDIAYSPAPWIVSDDQGKPVAHCDDETDAMATVALLDPGRRFNAHPLGQLGRWYSPAEANARFELAGAAR